MKRVGEGTDKIEVKRGAWCCPQCKNHRCKTLNGINLHLYRKHGGAGFGIYRTASELAAARRRS